MNFTHWWSVSTVVAAEQFYMWGRGERLHRVKLQPFFLLIFYKHELYPCHTSSSHHRRQMVNHLHIYTIIVFYYFSFYYYSYIIICQVTNCLCEELNWNRRFGELFLLLFLLYFCPRLWQFTIICVG